MERYVWMRGLLYSSLHGIGVCGLWMRAWLVAALCICSMAEQAVLIRAQERIDTTETLSRDLEDIDLAELDELFENDSLGVKGEVIKGSKLIGFLSAFEVLGVRISHGILLPRHHSDAFKTRFYSSVTEVGLIVTPKLFKQRLGIKVGLTIGWEKYRLRREQYLHYTAAGTELRSTSEELGIGDLRTSMFRTSFVSVPLEFIVYPFRRREASVWFGVGGYVRYAWQGQHKLRYVVNGKRIVEKLRFPYQVERFQYGVRARVGIGRNLSIFYQYGFSRLFQKDRAPENNRDARNSAIGITIGK